jgi:hypothetical protein
MLNVLDDNYFGRLYLFRWQRKNAIFACQQGGE